MAQSWLSRSDPDLAAMPRDQALEMVAASMKKAFALVGSRCAEPQPR